MARNRYIWLLLVVATAFLLALFIFCAGNDVPEIPAPVHERGSADGRKHGGDRPAGREPGSDNLDDESVNITRGSGRDDAHGEGIGVARGRLEDGLGTGGTRSAPAADAGGSREWGDLGKYVVGMELKIAPRSKRKQAACCLSRDGKLLVTCSDLSRKTTLRRIDTMSGTVGLEKALPAGVGTVRQLLFSEDEKTVFIVHVSGVRRIGAADLADKGKVAVPKPTNSSFYGRELLAAEIGPEGLVLAEVLRLQPGAEYAGVLVERRKGLLFLGIVERKKTQNAFAVSRSGQLAALLSTHDRRGGSDEDEKNPPDSLFLLDLKAPNGADGKQASIRQQRKWNRRPVAGDLLAIGPGGTVLAVGRDDGAILLLDREGRPLGKELRGGSEPALGVTDVVRFSADGSSLVSGHRGNSIALWDVGKRKLRGLRELSSEPDAKIQKRPFNHDGVREIHCSESMDVIVVVSDDGILRVLKSVRPEGESGRDR